MIQILAYTDGTEAAEAALRFAARLAMRLEGTLAVATHRAGTHATENPPAAGAEIDLADPDGLPPALRSLANAAALLAEEGVVAPPNLARIQETAHGLSFHLDGALPRRIGFFKCYGRFVESLNRLVADFDFNLVVVGAPRKGALAAMALGDPARRLALDLTASVLVARGGGIDSPWMVCADGSAAGRRAFPMLRHLMPAIRRPLEMIFVQTPDMDDARMAAAMDCRDHAGQWLGACGKKGPFHHLEGENRLPLILKAAGADAVLVMGASLRHDVYRRIVGSLPIKVMGATDASVLLVKLPPDPDGVFFKDPLIC